MSMVGNQLTPMEFNYLQRVKVYRLNDDGKWDDKGTGHVSVEYLERSDAVGLVVIDEDDHATLLVHRISADDIYQRQEVAAKGKFSLGYWGSTDTIISWTDPEVATDLALSFQETMGCAYIWDQICSVQRQSQYPPVTIDTSPRHLGDDLEHSGTSQDDDDALPDGGGGDVMDLPPVDLKNLHQIVKTVTDVSPFQRDRVAAMLLRDQNYVGKILEQFRICEDLENLEGLHELYKIVKGLVLLNDGHLFDLLFNDEMIMDVVGALEYDPELPERQNHRTYLKEQVVFKEAVPICDPVVLSKIHQTYKIGYIKDVILPRVLDDQTSGTLNSLMLFNSLEVVTSLHVDRPFMTELFSRLINCNPSEQKWKDLVSFLQEFCNLHKHLPPAQRNQLFSDLITAGLFEIVTTTLQHPDESIRLSGTDVLMATLNPDPAALRAFLVDQSEHLLFGLLVKGMLTPGEGGLQVQLLEILRLLLDPDTMDGPEKNKFLDVFYDQYVDQLVGALTIMPQRNSLEGPEQVAKREISPDVLGNICELLCFCVQHHSFRIKYYVLRNNVVEKVLRLLRRREKFLVVAAVRFLRTCIGLKDEFYYRYLLKNNLFEHVIQAFIANGNRYNLLNSAIIEMVDFIRKENVKSLIAHLVETYGQQLASVDYVDTFKQLQLKYVQSKEGPAVNETLPIVATTGTEKEVGTERIRELRGATGLASQRRRKEDRGLDKDEENYFNEDSDEEEDTASAPVQIVKPKAATPIMVNGAVSVLKDSPLRKTPFGLVDYDDEDDDGPPETVTNGVHIREENRQDGEVNVGGEVKVGGEGGSPGKKRGGVIEETMDPVESPGKKRRYDSSPGQGSGGKRETGSLPEGSGRDSCGAKDRSTGVEGEENEWFDRGYEWRGGVSGGSGVGGGGGGGHSNHGNRGGNSGERKGSPGGIKNRPGGGTVRLLVSSKDLDHGSRKTVPISGKGEEKEKTTLGRQSTIEETASLRSSDEDRSGDRGEGVEGGVVVVASDEARKSGTAAVETERIEPESKEREREREREGEWERENQKETVMEGGKFLEEEAHRLPDSRQAGEGEGEAYSESDDKKINSIENRQKNGSFSLHGESESRFQGQQNVTGNHMEPSGSKSGNNNKFGGLDEKEETDLGSESPMGLTSDVLRTESSPEPFPVR